MVTYKKVLITLVIFCKTMGATIDYTSMAAYMAPGDIQTTCDTLFNDENFKKAFVDKDIATLSQQGCTFCSTGWGNIVVEHPGLPGYLIKGEKPGSNRNWKRVLYGEEIKKAIGDNPYFAVVTEYLYHYPHHSNEFSSDNYCIISKKEDFKDITLAHYLADKPERLAEIQTIMKQVGYWDPGISQNIFVTTNDVIVFIDTEPYPSDHIYLTQKILDFIFFRLQAPGVFTAHKIQTMVENARKKLLSL